MYSNKNIDRAAAAIINIPVHAPPPGDSFFFTAFRRTSQREELSLGWLYVLVVRNMWEFINKTTESKTSLKYFEIGGYWLFFLNLILLRILALMSNKYISLNKFSTQQTCCEKPCRVIKSSLSSFVISKYPPTQKRLRDGATFILKGSQSHTQSSVKFGRPVDRTLCVDRSGCRWTAVRFWDQHLVWHVNLERLF